MYDLQIENNFPNLLHSTLNTRCALPKCMYFELKQNAADSIREPLSVFYCCKWIFSSSILHMSVNFLFVFSSPTKTNLTLFLCTNLYELWCQDHVLWRPKPIWKPKTSVERHTLTHIIKLPHLTIPSWWSLDSPHEVQFNLKSKKNYYGSFFIFFRLLAPNTRIV